MQSGSFLNAMRSPLKHGIHAEDQTSVDCFDRITCLPDELLGRILSFLSTRCAVSTSILSTKWRYIYTLTDCLSFHDELYFDELGEIKLARKTNMEFVYKVFELTQIPPIKSFSLCSGSFCDRYDLEASVGSEVEKGVQEHDYHVARNAFVPDALFICETLVKLELGFLCCMQHEIKIPLSVRLPRLKILRLLYVRIIGSDSIERLFTSCAVLEELALDSCVFSIDRDVILSTRLLKVLTVEGCNFKDGIFGIDAPNLAFLTYTSNFGMKIVPSWKDLCSLVKAKVDFVYRKANYGVNDDFYLRAKDWLLYDRELLKAAACVVTELWFMVDSFELILMQVDREQMPDFHSLSRLTLSKIPCGAWKYVTSLLEKSPQLETIIFDEGLGESSPGSQIIPPNEPLGPFSCHAKVIEVYEYHDCECTLSYMGNLLRNARSLKSLIVNVNIDRVDSVELIRKKLLMLPCASRDCCIEIDNLYSP